MPETVHCNYTDSEVPLDYTTFRIPKKTRCPECKSKAVESGKGMCRCRKGHTWEAGYRKIEAPNATLKQVQRLILKELYIRSEMAKNKDSKVPRIYRPSPFSHGFFPGRNTKSAALPHVGRQFVMAVDVSDFFPSIKAKKFFEIVPIDDEHLKEDIQNLCFKADGSLPQGESHYTPQGSPTSPHLANLFMLRFDWTMAWLMFILTEGDTVKGNYTRYADDLIFSSDNRNIRAMVNKTAEQLKKLNLEVNFKKIRFMPRSRRQIIYGIVVNEKPHLPREFRKNLRAAEHQLKLGRRNMDNQLFGELAYRHMVQVDERRCIKSSDAVTPMWVMKDIEK